ncbi:cobalt-precorrin-6A reductase [Thermocoleostomius sinensis]|uniref:Cobalt-precorrin-6A reductase n=1 Tax=Thermocoleostomius sinensis A174 TaxID=2016057 RepID=A0A9E9C8A3_9CYAN|nr:cobalt-precorrin-6A reductase [Thermocoleostomius sinensis]WAL60108.1 cobalt-precorrin-6A reductase [Thermocoleostomius sinensis A174]
MTSTSPTIWLIGGTQESAELANAIAHRQVPCLVTVTTDAARSLYPTTPTLQVRVGALHREQAETLLRTYHIGCILDASHPFAVEISTLAIALAQHYHLPYLRYERPVLASPSFVQTLNSPLHLISWQALLTDNYLAGQRVLLTIGYKNLALFHAWHDRACLFARILPSTVALEAALQAGFTSDRLIALRPPYTAALERALWQQWQITKVVTKASGSAGGEDIKYQIAAELGVQLIVIDRPAIAYPCQTSDFQTALSFCDTLGTAYPPTPS